ncbi:uncharacterized protein LOC118403754 [Branchiostoma floridae]|uniref:Uncharacterized protein LOC118403754 n=1 Tax=Branchiostoma floridae TaxID=7739 RepID=A0A9J7HFQ6_BRAFL|nr:uncharacterized protein LOC118403754 [Branchiostoma floridae]
MEKFFDIIVDRARDDWKEIGRRLGVTEADIRAIEQHRREDPTEGCRDVLNQWKRMKGDRGTVDDLIKVLEERKRKDVAEELEAEAEILQAKMRDQRQQEQQVQDREKSPMSWQTLRKHRAEIAKGLVERGKVTRVAYGLHERGVVTADEVDVIITEETQGDQAETLLRLLPTKPVSGLRLLCQVMRENNCQELAETLEKAADSTRSRLPNNVPKTVPHYYTSSNFSVLRQTLEQKYLAVLAGINGSGKTQLACHFANCFLDKTPEAIAWMFNGSGRESLRIGIQQLLRGIVGKDLHDDEKRLQLELRRSGVHALLVIDDLQDSSLVPAWMLQGDSLCQIIITTNNRNLLPNRDVVDITGFTEDEADQFLVGPNGLPHGWDIDAVHTLARRFSCLPLGLAAARAYIADAHIDPQEYLELLETKASAKRIQKREDTWLAPYYTSRGDVGRNLYAAINLSFGKMEPTVRRMFSFIALMDSSIIPLAVLTGTMESCHDAEAMAVVNDMVIQVEHLSLGTVEVVRSQRQMTVHEATQHALLFWMEDEAKNEMVAILLRTLVKFFNKDLRLSTERSFAIKLLPHVKQVIEQATNQELRNDQKLMIARLHEVIGHLYTHLGRAEDSEIELRRAMELIQEVAGIASETTETSADSASIHTEETLIEKARHVTDRLMTIAEQVSDEFFKAISRRLLSKSDIDTFQNVLPRDDRLLSKLSRVSHKQRPVSDAVYDSLVKNGLAVPDDILKVAIIPEIYASVCYSLGRLCFYLKDKYRKGTTERTELEIYLHMAHYISEEIKRRAGLTTLMHYKSQATGVLFLKVDITGETSEESRRQDLLEAVSKYEELIRMEGKYFELGLLKKYGREEYAVMVCTGQLTRCYSLLTSLESNESQRKDFHHRGADHCKELINLAKGQHDVTRLASNFNKAGNYFLQGEEPEHLDEAIYWFRQAFNEEMNRQNFDFPLVDAEKGTKF